ncbi:hypothetical protein ACTQ49_11075 [Luteococcus sp. Sow4_B9]|uniref:hypothetical protein n=1 Tax=Luteococcus sp. Sow4_B9 TaxID=3438792 RepID=UPI003F9A0FBC
MRELGEQTRDWFCQAPMGDEPVQITPTGWFTDDAWFLDQDHRTTIPAEGWWALQPGEAHGRIVGGNLCTLNLLQGTAWMPSLPDAVLMVEDDEISNATEFRRDLNSLMQQPGAETVQGLVIGRFQQASAMGRDDLEAIVATIPSLAGKPVLANVDFGHTNPLITFPVGGMMRFTAGYSSELTLVTH